MGCKLNSLHTLVLSKIPISKPERRTNTITFCSSTSSYNPNQEAPISSLTSNQSQISKQTDTHRTRVDFKTLQACKLGISRYPDFEYNAEGGCGNGSATRSDKDDEISVSFDLETLYIPPLTSATTKFLGLPLPPFLKIDIVPQFFQGTIFQESGKVELEFKAKFLFSIGSVYRAPPLLVSTVLTSEESKGSMRSGRGERLDEQGKCRLVGVASVDPIHDFVMDSFLALPTECLANLNAFISFST